MGGNGHCFFRTWIKAENAYNNKTQDEADITKAALQLRLEAIKHMRKHTAEYKEAWCDDTMEEQYQRAGQPAPKNFEDFLKQASKKNYWVNEHLIQAVATRTGTPCVIWRSYSDDTGRKLWHRGVWAPAFKNGFAKATSKCSRLTLMLRSNHYTCVIPPEHSDPPSTWLAEPHWRQTITSLANSKTHHPTGGAAPHQKQTLQAIQAVQTAGGPAPRPTRLVGVPAHLEAPLQVQGAKTYFPAQQKAVPAKASPNALRCKSSRTQSYHRQHSSSTNQPLPMEMALGRGAGKSSRNLAAKRTSHMKFRHKEIPPHLRGTRINRAQIVEASKELPIEERGWSCPFCNAGLPVFHGYHQKQVNIWHHYDAKHKRRNTSKEAILKTRFKQYRNNKTNLPGLWKSKEKIIAKRMENNTRDMTIGGHTLCIIRPDWASWPSKTIKNPSSRSLRHLPLGLPSGNSNGKAAEQHETER